MVPSGGFLFCCHQRSPESFAGKGMAGTGFEIAFKGFCLLFVGERNVGHQSPWYLLCRMWRSSAVVFSESLSQVRGDADIALAGERFAL
jgi:hypothetical protein